MIIEAEDVQVESGSARKSDVRAPPARSRCVSLNFSPRSLRGRR